MRETPKLYAQIVYSLQDHPRVCGKHTDFDFQLLDQQGSPPRMRETPLCDIFRPRPDRITPVYAGNTVKIPLYYATPKFKLRNFHLLF